MTPLEQSGLPWIMMAREDAVGTMRTDVVPALLMASRRSPCDAPGAFDPVCRIQTDPHSRTLTLKLGHTRFDDGTTVVRARITIEPECLDALGHDPHETEGPGVAATMLRIVRALDAAPFVRTPDREEDVADVPGRLRAIHAATRMRSRLSVPLVVDEAIAAHAATPLGLGGVHVAAHPSHPERGTLVDASPDLCIPGAVSVRHLRKRNTQVNQTTVMLHIGDAPVMFDAEALDPLVMLRMEGEHPWNPCHVRIDRDRPDDGIPKALRA